LEPGGFADRVEGKGKAVEAKEFVNGETAAGPSVVVVEGKEAAGDDGIVEGVEAELDGFVPVGVDVEKSDLRDAGGREGMLEEPGNNADAGEVGTGAAKQALDATRAGFKVANPIGSFGAVDGSSGRHAAEDVEKPESARQAGMRGGASEKGGGTTFVDTALDEVAGEQLVFDDLSKAGEALNTVGGDHGVAADEAGDTVFGETREPRVQETGGRRRGIRHGRQRRTHPLTKNSGKSANHNNF
jgi:hypothetical protein